MQLPHAGPPPAPACRAGCAACCIAPSISTPIPLPPPAAGARAKAAGERCWQLDEADRCRLFGRPERPAVCGSLQPSRTMCGDDRRHALQWLAALEADTAPGRPAGPG